MMVILIYCNMYNIMYPNAMFFLGLSVCLESAVHIYPKCGCFHKVCMMINRLIIEWSIYLFFRQFDVDIMWDVQTMYR